MAIVPLMFRNWYDDYDYDFAPRPTLICASFTRPQAAQHQQNSLDSLLSQDTRSKVNIGKEKFEVLVDVQQFSPKEINVKVENGFLVVEGKHEEKQDEHGFVARQFCRRYKLPKEVDPESIRPSLSSDGMLALRAPLKNAEPPKPQERVVPITHTGKPARKEEPKPVENNK